MTTLLRFIMAIWMGCVLKIIIETDKVGKFLGSTPPPLRDIRKHIRMS